MNRMRVAVLFFIAIMVMFGSFSCARRDTGDMWAKAKEAQNKGLPQSAITELQKIYPIALANRNYGEALKAITLQIFLESTIKGNKPEYKVNRLREEIARAPRQMRPLMKTALAQWYWHYYSRNRYRFLNRSQTADVKDDDFTTWDLRRIFKEISDIYQDLLKDESGLKKMKVADFKDVLIPGTAPPSLRPTLYDFVAWQALEFYTSGEQAGAKPEDAFVIDAQSPAFEDAAKFIGYSPKTGDTDSPQLHALAIYQNLIRIHLHDADKDAFIDADLHRLNYVFNVAAGEGRDEIYARRLSEIIAKYPQSELSSLAYYFLAAQLYGRNKLMDAYSTAQKGHDAHSGSYGADKCSQLMSTIAARSLELKTERVVAPNRKSCILVRYRNIDSVTIRVVKDDWKHYLDQRSSMINPGEERLKILQNSAPVAEETRQLAPTSDYTQKEALVDIPSLKPGLYRLFASHKKDFSLKDNSIYQCFLWVSDIVAIMREQEGTIDGFIVQGESGTPVAGATVRFYTAGDYNATSFAVEGAARTDEKGCFSFKSPTPESSRRVRIYASDNKGSEYLDPNDAYLYRNSRDTERRKVVFFTDRSLYRPGQMVHFKGIAIDIDHASRNYRVVPHEKVAVSFNDVNGQEIQKAAFTANAFGSFSGTFRTPQDRLTGSMSLTSKTPAGSCQISVEEYKRPKFSVKLNLPDKGFRLDEVVSVPGEAMAYTGAPIDGAKVAYRVVREVRMPYWWYYFARGGASYDAQEIAHGTGITDGSGRFTIAFTAKPDTRVKKSEEPTFVYTLFADVTDSAGETRSDSKSIRLGYTAMEASLFAEQWQVTGTPVALTVRTSTLDGAPQKAQGSVEVFRQRQPDSPVRPGLQQRAGASDGSEKQGEPDFSSINSWPDDRSVAKSAFATAADGTCTLSFPLEAGPYRARLTSRDAFGNKVSAVLQFLVCDRTSRTCAIRLPSCYTVKSSTVEVGETFEALWGTGYQKGQAFVEVFRENIPIKRFWTDAAATQSFIRLPMEERYRGGLTVQVTFVKACKMYTHRTDIVVPWSTKEFQVSLETFRSKLLPGQHETWTLKVRGPGAQRKAAELVATLYDESLDAFLPHRWSSLINYFFHNYTSLNQRFTNQDEIFYAFFSDWNHYSGVPDRTYVGFTDEIDADLSGYGYLKDKASMENQRRGPGDVSGGAPEAAPVLQKSMNGPEGHGGSETKRDRMEEPAKQPATGEPRASKPEAAVRKNLNETAFFLPHLVTGKDGTVKIQFVIPEALTRWHFMAMAHGNSMESGLVEGHTVTQKDLMVQPNPPRFLRQGDALEFTVKVANMVKKDIKGRVRLSFFAPDTGASLDTALDNRTLEQELSIPPGASKSFSWKIKAPEGIQMAGYRATASAGNQQDGEEGAIPIISRMILVSESMPLWIRGPGEKRFVFEKLRKSGDSRSLVNQGFTLQMASNPAWYAVQALPYLIEFPHECSEQVFNRLYANALARHIANSDPKIKKIFRNWREQQPGALRSNLEKNQELKSVLLLETPWVLQANKETDAKHHVGVLFDDARMNSEISAASRKLAQMQLESGAWPWFPGGRPDTYITLYVTTGFARLKHMQISGVDEGSATKAIGYLDRWILETYQEIVRNNHLHENNLTSMVAMYLYCRGFYLAEKPVPPESKVAVEYFLGQARSHWLDLGIRMSQAHCALGLWSFGDRKTPRDIMASIRERSETSEELGMFWSEGELSWWWYRAPIETQALMIEAFADIMGDQKAVEECKVWLLKQKETQDWKTTKATSDAIYGLLCRGRNLLLSDAPVEVSCGGTKVDPGKIEEGTGFYEKRWDGPSVKPQFGDITVNKKDSGIAWGGAHWQYLEDIAQVTADKGNPLKLKKSVFVQRNSARGPVIEPVRKELAPGDLLKIRIELRVDRDMEYVHMRDQRGSGLEPVNVISQYKYQDGLSYYESTKDTATHFYMDYLPKGTYVFEYPLRVVHRGTYQNGCAFIECMYAPQFSSHSESQELVVK
jgi:uncharacterized protein YfaS (alpha-2-macroglobulin family)